MVEFKYRTVIEKWDFLNAGHLGYRSAATHIDEDAWRRQQFLTDANPIRRLESRVPFYHRAAGHATQSVLDSRARVRNHGVGARLYPLHVYAYRTFEEETKVCSAPSKVCSVGTRHKSLRRRAPGINACAAEEFPLDESHRHAGACQSSGERRSGLTGADDNRVEFSHPIASPHVALLD
jgi:hypothetical protein